MKRTVKHMGINSMPGMDQFCRRTLSGLAQSPAHVAQTPQRVQAARHAHIVLEKALAPCDSTPYTPSLCGTTFQLHPKVHSGCHRSTPSHSHLICVPQRPCLRRQRTWSHSSLCP